MRVVPLATFTKHAEALAALAGVVAQLEAELVRTGAIAPLAPGSPAGASPRGRLAETPTTRIVEAQALRLAEHEEGVTVATPQVVDAAIVRALLQTRSGDDGPPDFGGGRALVEQCTVEFRAAVEQGREQLRADLMAVESKVDRQGEALQAAADGLRRLEADVLRTRDSIEVHRQEICGLQGAQSELRGGVQQVADDAAAQGATVWQIAKADAQALREELTALRQSAQEERKRLGGLTASCEASMAVATEQFARLEAELRVLPLTERHRAMAATLLQGRGFQVLAEVGGAHDRSLPGDAGDVESAEAAGPDVRRRSSVGRAWAGDVDRRLGRVEEDLADAGAQARAYQEMAQAGLEALRAEVAGSSAQLGLQLDEVRAALARADSAARAEAAEARREAAEAHEGLGLRLARAEADLEAQVSQAAGHKVELVAVRDEVQQATRGLSETMDNRLQEHGATSASEGTRMTAEMGDQLRAYVDERLREAKAVFETQVQAASAGLLGAITSRAEVGERNLSKACDQLRGESLEAQAGIALHFDRLREDLAKARHDAATELADSSRVGKDELAHAVATIESRQRIELAETRKCLSAAVDEFRLERNGLLAHARGCCEAGHQRAREEAAEDRERLAAEMQASLDRVATKFDTETTRIHGEVSLVHSRVAQHAACWEEKLKAYEGAFQDALVTMRTQDLRAQADEGRRLKSAVGSLARGIVGVAQVCGILPKSPTEAADADADLMLDWELCGRPLQRRIEESWARLSPTGATLVELARSTAEGAASRAAALHSALAAVPAAAGAGGAAARSLQPVPPGTPRGGAAATPRGGRLLAPAASGPAPPKDWSRATAALMPLSPPKMGASLAELRANPELRATWHRGE